MPRIEKNSDFISTLSSLPTEQQHKLAKKFISGPLRPADVSFDPTNIPRKIRAKK